jgi:hypothetical protein
MNLIPEKRLDKTGKLVTRHVRSDSSSSLVSTSLPAPSVAPQKAQRKQSPATPKLRPKQLQQELYKESLYQGLVSSNLREDNTSFLTKKSQFRANDVEFFAVLAVAYEGDAIKMLNDGVRTTEDAITYMRDRGMEPPFDRSALAQKALERNITPDHYRHFFRTANTATINLKSPHLVDAIELFGIMSLKDQYHDVARFICYGEVRLTDIKKIGAVKLKGYHRLRDTIPAFKALQEPDCKFTHEDIKNLLGRVMPAGNSSGARYKNDYETAIRYLVRYGPEFIESVNLNELNGQDRKFAFMEMTGRMERAKFHLHLLDTPLYGADIDRLYEAQVDPVRANELAMAGMSVTSILGVIQEEVPSSMSSGWL